MRIPAWKSTKCPEGKVATCSTSKITASEKYVCCVPDQSFRASGAKVQLQKEQRVDTDVKENQEIIGHARLAYRYLVIF